MYVFILEDDKIQSSLLYEILNRNYEGCKITSADNIREAESTLYNDDFDVYLLDVEVGDAISVDYLEKVIAKKPQISKKIIFITAYKKYAMDALNKVHCFGYVEKPYEEAKLIEVIESCLAFCSKLDNPISFFSFKIRGESHFIDKEHILFFEFKNKKPIMHTISDTITLPRMTAKQLLENLNEDHNENFIRCRRDTIVNLMQIAIVKKQDSLNYVVFNNGVSVPIGDKYKGDLFSKLRI